MSAVHGAQVSQEQLSVFKRCFSGRMDAYGTYDTTTGRAYQVKRPVTDQVLLDHLHGKTPYGVYLLVDTMTHAVVADFDHDDPGPPCAFITRAAKHGIHSYLERSKSKGWHVWVFAEHPGISAAKARQIVTLFLSDMGQDATEVFPRQDQLSDTTRYGNFIYAPLFGSLTARGRTVFVDVGRGLKPYADQWAVLAGVRRLSAGHLDQLVGGLKAPAPAPVRTHARPVLRHNASATLGLPPCAQRMLAEGVTSNQRVACFRLAVMLKNAGLPRDLAVASLRAWARKNRPVEGKTIITDAEIVTQTGDAYAKPYRGRGCEEPALQPYCSADCPLRSRERPNIQVSQPLTPPTEARASSTGPGGGQGSGVLVPRMD